MSLASWPARLYVVAFVGAIVVCGALSIEAWPFTSLRLFSRERREVATSWIATSVDAHGHETQIPFNRFSQANRHFVSVMSSYARLTPRARAATCRGWARLVRRRGGSVAGGLRLYATARDMRRHVGHRGRVTATASLRWTCAGGRGPRAAEDVRSARAAGMRAARAPR